MSVETVEESPKNLTRAATGVYGIVYEGLREGRKIHYETAISACGFLAGVTLLRGMNVSYGDKKMGEPYAATGIDQAAIRVIEYMQGTCAQESMGRDGGWLDPIPRDHRPNKRMHELVNQFEPRFRGLVVEYQVPAELAPFVAARAAVQFIKASRDSLHIDIGKALAAASVVKAAKTVPPRAMPPVTAKGTKPWWRFW